MQYIHQKEGWPVFVWDKILVSELLQKIMFQQGKLLGQMSNLGFSLQTESSFITLCNEILHNSEIEGEILNKEEVRSSLANKLGITLNHWKKPGRDVEGIVEMMLDANQNYQEPLTDSRLFNWHASLFPTGKSGMQKHRSWWVER